MREAMFVALMPTCTDRVGGLGVGSCWGGWSLWTGIGLLAIMSTLEPHIRWFERRLGNHKQEKGPEGEQSGETTGEQTRRQAKTEK